MDTKPQTTESSESFNRYRQTLLKYVDTLPLNETFEESAISQATELEGHKVPKMFIREILTGVSGIDQDILKKGQVCRKETVDAG